MEEPERRYGLEEVRLNRHETAAFPSTTERSAPSDPLSTSHASRQLDPVRCLASADNGLLRPPDVSAVQDRQLISCFWEKYVPNDYVAQGRSPCVWVEQLLALPSLGKTLQLSMKALAMTRLAWINNDNSMALQGNRMYGRALNSVQHALCSQDMAMHDDLFIAGYVFSIFESTTKSIAGWNRHVSGLLQLVLARGPRRHQLPIARATFEEFRASAMIQCIQYRKSSFLGTEEWRTVPWEIRPKDVYQKLYDKGFALAALLEELDLANLPSPQTSISTLSAFLQRLSDLDFEIEQWLEILVSECPSPLYWHSHSRSKVGYASSCSRLGEAFETGSLLPYTFSNLRIAHIIITHWALRMILSNTISLTCHAILTAERPLLFTESSISSGIRLMAQQQFSQHGGSIRLKYATSVMRSMPYCLSDSMGLVGAQKSLFALRTALFCLQRHPGEELRWCQAIYQQLDSQKGLRYAREIAKLDGKHSASGRDSLPVRTLGVNPAH